MTLGRCAAVSGDFTIAGLDRMPFIVIPVKGGYKVKKNVPGGETYSKKPLTKAKAEAQRRAIYVSERKR